MVDDEMALFSALEKLESHLELPIVPGELVNWVRALHSVLDVLRPPLLNQIASVHPDEFVQIAVREPSLMPRVEQLRQEDQQLLRQLEILSTLAERFIDRAGDLGHEDQLQVDEISHLLQRAMALLIRVHAQEAATTISFVEAFHQRQGIE